MENIYQYKLNGIITRMEELKLDARGSEHELTIAEALLYLKCIKKRLE